MKKRRKVVPKSQVTSTRATGNNSPTDSPSVTRDQETPLFEAAISQHPDQRKLLSSLSYNKNLLKYLNDDRACQTSFCDLLIIVEGKEFRVHKVVVAVGSSYFHACLSKNPMTQVVTLDHVSSSVFQHLLHFLYTSEFLVWDNEINLVLEAARFLDIIDAVKLLAAENIAHSVVGDESLPTEDESTTNTETPNICPTCGRNFCYRKTLDNHMIKAHGLAKTSDILSDDPSTRKSMRKMKSPVKFENGEERDKETLSSDESSNGGHDRAVSGSEMNEEVEVLQIEEDDAEETSGGDEGQTNCDVGETVDGNPNLNTSGNYPDGLEPIVLQDSSKKELKCPKCGKVFDRIGKYESHTRVHTGEKPFECDICQQRYSTKSNLTVHRKRHSSDTVIPSKEHKCPFCSKLHASRKTLVKHIRRFHPEKAQEFLAIKKITSEGWKCDICNKTFTRRLHLEEHMILHTQDKPFKCLYCDEKFKSRFKRLKHQEKFHLGPFPCDICGRQFNDSGNLKRHIDYTHGEKRKWTCFVCGKSVRERTTLKEHMRIHSGEKPHLCSICGQSFRHGSSYRLHLRVHHEDKRYECEECGKTFIRHDHLTKHKKIHSGEKAHQCEECGKCFGRRDHLTVHYKSVHLGEKVWQKYKATFHQCEVCKKVFKGKSSLEMHFRTHSGEKPHKCQICNQSFRIKKTLTKHLVIHSDARPFNCQHCNATFKRKDKLKYHIDHVHGSKTEQEMHEEPKTVPAAPEKAVPERPASKKAVPEKAASKKAVPDRAASKKAAPERTTFEKIATERAVSEKAAPGRTFSDGTNADIYVPLTLVPFEIAEMDGELERHVASSVNPSQAEYQRTPDIAFLEKYTLTPQPATLLHPVRAEQILEGREHSYLGILLGLDPQHPVQGVVTGENH